MKRYFAGFAAVLFFVAIWEILVRLSLIDAELFPSVLVILRRTTELVTNQQFVIGDLGASLTRFSEAAIIVVPSAVFLALVAAIYPSLWMVGSPFFNFTFPLPKVAIVPIIFVTFGIGDLGKVVLIGIGMFYPLFLNVHRGACRLRDSEYGDLVAIYRIRGIDLWYRFYFRGVLLDVFTGLKASFGYGFTLVVVSEMSASRNGIGNFIWRAWDAYSIVDMYAGIAILCLVGWLLQMTLDLLAARAARHRALGSD